MKMNQLKQQSVFLLLFLGLGLVLTGCAGPLDSATKQALDSTYARKRYVAKVYLGNHHNLDYTNNSVDGRSPTGVFIDSSLLHRYETDASFFESGSSGREYTLKQLQEIDLDLDMNSFGQGIQAGQLVVIKDISDKSDQVVFEVETVTRYPVRRTYGVGTSSRAKPRASRIHCVFGKDGMQQLDQTLLSEMIETLLAPAPSLMTERQKQDYILSNIPGTSFDDLVNITGLSKEKIRQIYFSHILSQSQFHPELQTAMTNLLVDDYDNWAEDAGIYLKNIQIDENTLILDYTIQEISNAMVYHSPELRAGLLFFDGFSLVARAFGHAISAHASGDFSQHVVLTCSYPYFDRTGRRFSEQVSYTFSGDELAQYANSSLTKQELADRSEILVNAAPVRVSLQALEAVKNVKQNGPTGWKFVRVHIIDWEYEEDDENDMVTIEGYVENTGTWIAENVEVTATGYNKYGFEHREESTTLYGLLKPGETERFTIRMNSEDLRRYRLFLEWDEVE